MSPLPFPVGSPAPNRAPQSAPAATPAASASRAAAVRQADTRARAASNAERTRPDDRDAPARADRETPPDFAALLALLGRAPLGPPPEPTERPALGLSAEANSTGNDEVEAEATTDDLLAETRRETLRSVRAMLAASGELLSTGSDRNVRSVVERAAQGQVAGPLANGASARAELLALAGRAERAGQGELLARNDAQAAGVRAALDALLDMAGTPAGRAVADGMVPPTGSAIAAPDPTEVVRDTTLLAAEFRTRLDRVIARMRDEFGHDVQVVETHRSPERQAALFAQGRTTPGPIVTWTTNSAHLTGEAADVIIDGKWNYPQAYARLHEIAAEEGLNTLGMRDPGHLELRGSATGMLIAGDTAGAPRNTDVAPGIARVASVAQVAQVAQVARVATVARPGGGAVRNSGDDAGSSGDLPARGTLLNGATSLIAGRSGGSSASGGDARDASSDASARQASVPTRGERRRELEQALSRTAGGADPGASVGSVASTVERLGARGAPAVQPPVGSNAAARAETIAQLREDGPVRPISSLTMQLEGADGQSEAVRVSLRGGAVGTQVNTTDASLADRLRMQTASLQDALSQHGLESEPLRVERSSRATEAESLRSAIGERGDLAKATGANAGAGQQQGSSTDSGARERPTARQQDERDAQDAQETRDDRGEPHHQRRRDRRQEQE